MRVHVIPHDPFRPIPQKVQSRKDPSREARKFAGLENLVPIPYRDSLLRARPRYIVAISNRLVEVSLTFKVGIFCSLYWITMGSNFNLSGL